MSKNHQNNQESNTPTNPNTPPPPPKGPEPYRRRDYSVDKDIKKLVKEFKKSKGV
jgi:hypothetical protein